MSDNTSRKGIPLSKGYSTVLLLFLFLFVLLLASQLPDAYAASTEDNVSVDVNVTGLTEITVTPAAINWTSLTPGTAGGTRLLDIKNTGSVNVTNIYAFTSILDNETTRPYSSDDASSYSAAGVLVYHNESDSNFYWAGRLEWNWTEDINNLVWPATIEAPSRASHGFFQNASNSYVWVVGNGTNQSDSSSNCNNTDTVFAIEDDIDDGTAATRTPDSTGITRNGGDDDYSFFSVSRATNFLNGLCVAVSTNCEKIYVYEYDQSVNFSTCTNAGYIFDQNLVPNDIERITANAWIPRGIPAGNLTQAIWSFVASSS